jgi:uncharacterized damage-inducible protein DinB
VALDPFPLLARFNAWVNGRVYDAVARLPAAAYHAERGLFFGSIHRTLNHLLVVDRLWGGRFEGIDRGIVSLDQIVADEDASLKRARADEDARLVRLVDAMPIERLAEVVTYTRMVGGARAEIRRGHMLMTLFNHQTHHRGQVTAALSQERVDYAPLDLVMFLDEIGEGGPPGTIE